MNCKYCGAARVWLGSWECGTARVWSVESRGVVCKAVEPHYERASDLESKLESAQDTIECLREELRDANDRAETCRSAMRPGQLKHLEK